MMVEAEKLQCAKDYIAGELKKQAADRLDEISWDQGPWDPAVGIYRLVLSRDGEKSIFSFTKYELLKNHGSQQWKKELRDHVGDILMEL
jgi:hypothetical protein